MKAIRLEAVGQLHLRDQPMPVPGRDDLLVRVEASGICGTDRHLFHGEFPSRPPVTIGHEFCGVVEAVGADVVGFAPGVRITGDPNIACGRCAECLRGRVNLCHSLQALGIHRDGGLADYVLVPHRQAVALPPSVSALHGAFCEPLACCLHGIDGAGIVAGASVVVLGGGVIGLLVVQLARLAGATTVVLATRQAVRRRLAESIGATATVDPGAGDVVGAIVGPHGLVPGGADVVIECAGVAETVQQSLRVARRGATVVILGVMPQGETVAIEPFDLLVRELRVQGSFINPFVHQRAAALIGAGSIILDPLITRTVPLDGVVAVVTHPPSPGEVKVMAVPPG